jgi:ElaB/YqjD/DUF883 family membrane-anchored ribosome-binding protein
MATDVEANERTPADVQREIEETRAVLDDTLDVIGERLSPQEIKQRVIDYGNEKALQLAQIFQRHPAQCGAAGAALVGVILLRRRRNTQEGRERAAQAAAMILRVTAAADQPRRMEQVSSTLRDVAGRAGDFAYDTGRAVAQQAGNIVERAQHYTAGVADFPFAESAKRTVAAMESASRENPLLTIGAAFLAGVTLVSLFRR